MSRPSRTAPPGRAAKARCASISAARTLGHRRDDRGRLAHSRVRSGVFVEIGEAEPARGRHRGVDSSYRSRSSAIRASRRSRGKAGRCRDAAGRNAPQAAARCVPLPDAAGPSMAMIIRRARTPGLFALQALLRGRRRGCRGTRKPLRSTAARLAACAGRCARMTKTGGGCRPRTGGPRWI